MGLELLRQVHYFVSERSAGYHRFWSQRVFGGFDRAMKRRFSDWTRFRLARVVKVVAGHRAVRGRRRPDPGHLAGAGAVRRARAAVAGAAADPAAGLRVLLHRVPVHRPVLAAVARRRRHLLPGRHQDALLRRLGPGPRGPADPREHHVPGEAGRDRGEGRLRPRRHPAVGAARHRQDADGRGRRGRDRPAVRLRRPRRVHQHVHGRRDPQGQVAVPEAAQARAALRRRDRVLRRGGRAGQPRLAGPGRRPGGARGMRAAARSPHAGCHGFSYLSEDTRSLLTRERDGAARPARGAGAAQPLRHGRRDERRRWRDGHAAGAAHRAVRPEEAARHPQPLGPARAGHAAQAAAQVPDPRHDGDEHARGAGRGAAAPGPHRPHLQGRLPEQGRPDPHLRGLPGQGAARGHRARSWTSSPRSPRTPPARRSRTW